MLKVALKGVRAHKRRLMSTSLAVLLGVSFLCGTLVMGDTIQRTFANLLATVNSGTDAFVRSSQTISSAAHGPGAEVQRARIDASLLAKVRQVNGVAAAAAQVAGRATIFDKQRNELGAGAEGGPPNLAFSWIDDQQLNPFRISAGRAPAADGEVVIDRASAKQAGYAVGDTVSVGVPDARAFTLVGIATFGNQDNAGGATTALFSLPEAETLFSSPGKVDSISARAAPGVSQTELVQRISAILPPGIEVLTGAAITKEQQDSFQARISAFTTFFSAFGYIAVLVGAFVIYNTFSIIIAQRTREIALLRAVGASRRQVLGSVMVEAVAVGVAASVVGVIAGIGVGALLRAFFGAVGFSFPSGGLVLRPATVITGFVVGTGVTLFAALAPALRASRVAPLAALREGAVDTSSTSRTRGVAGALATLIGVLLVARGIASKDVTPIGFGAIVTLIGMIIAGPVVARPLSRVLGFPALRLKGVTGRLARDNAMRNPRRTSGTAAALMVGVAVVSVFTVLAASLKATADDQITKSFIGDLVVTSGMGFERGALGPELASKLAALPQVEAAAPIRRTDVEVNGKARSILATDATALSKVLRLDVVSGSLASLGDAQIAISDSESRDQRLSIGDTVTLSYPDTGSHRVTVAAIYKSLEPISSSYLISTKLDNANQIAPRDSFVYIKLKPGANVAAARTEVRQAIAGYPTAKVQDLASLKQTLTGHVNSLLAVLFGMLALSILIASIGISNTLQLSVHERTHELGLLRAVGTTRKQLRSMVRWESAIIALFGTVGGIALGDAFGWSVVNGLGRDNNILFRIPIGQSLFIVACGAMIGVLAAVRPAARASRLDVLRAIATE